MRNRLKDWFEFDCFLQSKATTSSGLVCSAGSWSGSVSIFTLQIAMFLPVASSFSLTARPNSHMRLWVFLAMLRQRLRSGWSGWREVVEEKLLKLLTKFVYENYESFNFLHELTETHPYLKSVSEEYRHLCGLAELTS